MPKESELAPIEDAEIEEIASSINMDDPSLSVVYGAETMSDIAKFADGLLSRIKAKDAGPIGDSLTDLMLQVKSIDVDAFGKKSIVEKIPVVGSLFNSAKRTLAKFDTLAEQIETISHRLEDSMVSIIRDIQILEQLFEHNKIYHRDLSVYIEAGKLRIQKAREQELPQLQARAEQSQDAMLAQEVKDFADKIHRFERRLHDLQLSRSITVQTAPQIRLIQSNNQTLAEKIQTSILSTIPIWKNQIVLALSLQGQQNAARLQKEVADTTNDLLKKNAEMLKSSSIETAREVERSIVDVETIRDVQKNLIETIEETMMIAKQGREQRAIVEQELQTMENELKEKLIDLAHKNRDEAIRSALTPAITSE